MAGKPTIIFLPHGGGPLPLLGDHKHKEMVDVLQKTAANIPRPDAIIMISAHWEEANPTITCHPGPSLLYDYYNFPDAAYQITYPAPGFPALAEAISAALGKNKFNPVLDQGRGFDHGMFVPLKIMYPNADIPCVQLSLLGSLDPRQHIDMGEALSQLIQATDNNILIIGSGMSFHNMQAFLHKGKVEKDNNNIHFENWLIDTCTNKHIDEAQRTQALVQWEQAPHARYCHPREEHLLPLHVCYGAAKTACQQVVSLAVMNKKVSLLMW